VYTILVLAAEDDSLLVEFYFASKTLVPSLAEVEMLDFFLFTDDLKYFLILLLFLWSRITFLYFGTSHPFYLWLGISKLGGVNHLNV
jgi:hypothetical protein